MTKTIEGCTVVASWKVYAYFFDVVATEDDEYLHAVHDSIWRNHRAWKRCDAAIEAMKETVLYELQILRRGETELLKIYPKSKAALRFIAKVDELIAKSNEDSDWLDQFRLDLGVRQDKFLQLKLF